jgi:hypothetical protein
MYVDTKVPAIIDVVTAITAIVNNFLFLVVIIIFVSPLRQD